MFFGNASFRKYTNLAPRNRLIQAQGSMCYPSFMVVKYLQTLVREEYSLYHVTIYVLFYKVAIEINHACFLFFFIMQDLSGRNQLGKVVSLCAKQGIPTSYEQEKYSSFLHYCKTLHVVVLKQLAWHSMHRELLQQVTI